MFDFLKALWASFQTKPKFNLVSVPFPSGYVNSNPIHTIPDPPANQMSGTDFGNSILNISATQQREDLIYQQCASGNIPNFMRNFKMITVQSGTNQLTYFVSPDVLCVGTDNDYLRVALNGITYKKIADLFGCILPTKVIADQIFQAADVKLTPVAMGANFNMISSQVMIAHNQIIQKQLNGRTFSLLTGHKKDIVLCKRLMIDHSSLALYGWFFPNGEAIQGPGVNSTSHSINYVDYSSSGRMVSRTAFLNGEKVDLLSILNGPNASLISDEGAYDASRIYNPN